MLASLASVYDFFSSPKRLARELSPAHPPLAPSLLAYSYAGMALFLAQSLLWNLPSVLPWPLALGSAVVFQLGSGFLMAAVSHFIAEMMGGRGSARNLFILFGFCELVWTLALPLVLLGLVLQSGPSQTGMLLFPGLGLASLILKVKVLEGHYGIGAARAWSVLILPYLAAFFFFFGGLALLLGSVLLSFL